MLWTKWVILSVHFSKKMYFDHILLFKKKVNCNFCISLILDTQFGWSYFPDLSFIFKIIHMFRFFYIIQLNSKSNKFI